MPKKSVKKAAVLNLSERRVRQSVENHMEAKNISKTRMSRDSGMSYQHFCGIMNGKKDISPKAAIKLLHACDCKIAPSQKKK